MNARSNTCISYVTDFKVTKQHIEYFNNLLNKDVSINDGNTLKLNGSMLNLLQECDNWLLKKDNKLFKNLNCKNFYKDKKSSEEFYEIIGFSLNRNYLTILVNFN